MNCLSASEKWSSFIEKNFKTIRAPFSAGIELLPECNFKCIHCYAASNRNNSLKSMSTAQICSVIDTLVQHNCIELYFTGGECLLHKDFEKIYTYAKKKGLLVSVLTNGSLINEKHINLWNKYMPELVSMTLYGADIDTYERVTGNKNGYNQLMRAINLLRENNIYFELKIIGLTENYDDIPKMRQFIRKLGQKNSILAWDIRPMNNGDSEPISYRVTPEQAFEVEKNDPERAYFLERLAYNENRSRKTNRQTGGYLYPCAAGYQFVFITHDGYMQSCVKAVEPRYNLIQGDFETGWKFLGEEYVEKKASKNFKCLNCDKFRYCGQCTAAFYSEMGDPEEPVPFYCELGELRKKYMDDIVKQNENNSSSINNI